MKLGVLGLAGLLLLTGCGSSPSVEDQIKLIEYQNCLEALRQVPFDFNSADKAMDAQAFQIDICSVYRP